MGAEVDCYRQLEKGFNEGFLIFPPFEWCNEWVKGESVCIQNSTLKTFWLHVPLWSNCAIIWHCVREPRDSGPTLVPTTLQPARVTGHGISLQKVAFPMTVYSSPNAPKGWQSKQQWQRLRSAETLYTAAHCTTLQHTATHCNALQHTATHYNTLQHTAVTRVYWDTCDGHKEVLGSYYALTWLQ